MAIYLNESKEMWCGSGKETKQIKNEKKRETTTEFWVHLTISNFFIIELVLITFLVVWEKSVINVIYTFFSTAAADPSSSFPGHVQMGEDDSGGG